ncbi:MAG: hypothetical protein HZA78_10555 [Candidatus Schekmanbacteria bacterium]|nr:hypothetical protein [Candidatus Schekmanbacteria bacterium]
MIEINQNFFSIVFIGYLNPLILNHNFLIDNNILPIEKDPFKRFIKNEGGKQFTEFVATPLLSTIKYDYIHITVEQHRFQILDISKILPHESVIANIAKKYFEVLPHTPLAMGGINFNYLLTFDSNESIDIFENQFVNKNIIQSKLELKNIMMGDYAIKFVSEETFGELRINAIKENPFKKILNINYENNNVSSFLENLDSISIKYNQAQEIINIITNLEG